RITSIVNFVNHIDTADLDGDGALDLISSSHADNKLAWYRNTNGQGDFSETQMVVSDQLPGARDAVANDMDSDGDMDILLFTFSDESTDVSTILWYENDGMGNFTQQHIIDTMNT